MKGDFLKEKKKAIIIVCIFLGIIFSAFSSLMLYFLDNDEKLPIEGLIFLCVILYLGVMFLSSGISYACFDIRAFINTVFYLFFFSIGMIASLTTVILFDNEEVGITVAVIIFLGAIFFLKRKKDEYIWRVTGYYDETDFNDDKDIKQDNIDNNEDGKSNFVVDDSDEGIIEFDLLQTYEKDGKILVYNYWMSEEEKNKIFFLGASESILDKSPIKYKYSRCLVVSTEYENIDIYRKYVDSIASRLVGMSNKSPFLIVGGTVIDEKNNKVIIYIYYVPKYAMKTYKRVMSVCKKLHMCNIMVESKKDENWDIFDEVLKPTKAVSAKVNIEYLTLILEEFNIDISKPQMVYFFISVGEKSTVEEVLDIFNNSPYKLCAKIKDNNSYYIIVTRELRLTKALLIAAVNWVISNLNDVDASYLKIEIDKEYVDRCLKECELI